MTTEDRRAAYHAFTEALIADFRANAGVVRSGSFKGQLLLLTTTGAKSGERRLTPVAYTRDGDDVIIVASNRGAPTNPAWFANLQARPEATIEIGSETIPVHASVAEGADRDRLYAAHAAMHPGFNDYVQMTDRVIPVVRLRRVG